MDVARIPARGVLSRTVGAAGARRTVVKRDSPLVGLTEHPLSDGTVLVFAANYEPCPVTCPITLSGTITQIWRGKATSDALTISANDIACFAVAPKSAD